MGLRGKQSEFLVLVADLIHWVASHEEWDFTLGDGFRDSRVFGAIGTKQGYGHKDSYHKRRLAIDLNLFMNGQYITSDHEVWQLIGEHWKSLHPDNVWGGDFSFRDYNHFSHGESR